MNFQPIVVQKARACQPITVQKEKAGRNTGGKKNDRLSTTVDSMSWPEIRAVLCHSVISP